MVRSADVVSIARCRGEKTWEKHSAAGGTSWRRQASRTWKRDDGPQGGGPVKWSQFYGRTAENFYHPTDRNTTYHTTTVLGQRSPVDDNQVEPGVPSRQGLPVHQRPPSSKYDTYKPIEMPKQGLNRMQPNFAIRSMLYRPAAGSLKTNKLPFGARSPSGL